MAKKKIRSKVVSHGHYRGWDKNSKDLPILEKSIDTMVAPSHTGKLYVRTNDWDFFLGDAIWEPVEDKISACGSPRQCPVRME